MKDTIIIKTLFLFVSCWGIALFFVWCRPKIDIFWKAVATGRFALYLWFFWGELNAGYNAFSADWSAVTLQFLREILTLVFVNLFVLWPVALAVIFYKASELESERLLKFLCILTLVLWVIFIIYVLFSKGIDKVMFDGVKKVLPRGK